MSENNSMENTTNEYICNAVLMNLASGGYSSLSDRIQKCFQSWCKLKDEDKERVNWYVTYKMRPDMKYIYNVMIEAFTVWDQTRNYMGAPGYDCKDLLTLLDHSDIEKKLSSVLSAVGELEIWFLCSKRKD